MTDIYEGVVEYDDGSPTDYLYRISINALIKNDNNEILVVKEAGRDFWDLPGGGMDHGEDIKSALARELYEEVGMTGDFTYRVVCVNDPDVLKRRPVWQLRIIYEVVPEIMKFIKGEDSDEIKFIDSRVFINEHAHYRERKIYEYAKLIK